MRDFVLAVVLAGVVAAGDAAAAASFQSGREVFDQDEEDDEDPPEPPTEIEIGEAPKVVAARLLRDGPAFYVPADRPLTSVQGFVRDGWPVVVDFEPQPGTRTDLRVSIYESKLNFFPRRVRLIMDADGGRGRQTFTGRIEMPVDLRTGQPVGIAQFEVISRRLNAAGKRTREVVPVEVYGIGAGPRAVGSISVTDVVFAPPASSLRLPANGKVPASYGYRLKQSFDLVSEDVTRSCKKFLCKETMLSNRLIRPVGPRGGNYRIGKAGTYRLNVRAWLSCPNADFDKCGDSAAWAIGRSPAVLVER